MLKSLPKYILLVFVTLSTVLLTYQVTTGSSPDSPFQVWTAPALERVNKQATKFPQVNNLTNQASPTNNQIHLKAAKGEYESFQIVVQSPKGSDLKNVNVIVSDLRNADQGIIDRGNITLYREHYLYVDKPSPQGLPNNPTRGKNWYPDGLIPFVDPDTGKDLKGANLDAVPFNLAKNENQPIWVDIYVPPDAQPGEYQGYYVVTSDQGKQVGRINLNVWDFQLPLKPTLNSHFLPWEDRGENVTAELLRHKIITGQHVRPEQQAELIDKLGLSSVRLPFWSGANYQTCTMSPAPSVTEIKQAAAVYDDRLLKFVYSADEIDNCPGIIKPLKEWANNVHQAGIKHLVVMKPRPDLYDDVDIWVVQPDMYETGAAEIAEVMKKGDEVWFYSGYHTDYSPQWTMDALPINFRIAQGFIAPNLNLTGILYPQIDAWTDDPSKVPLNTDQPWYKPSVYEHSKERNFSGEGVMIYPGEEVGIKGVVPSLRLKRIRDGVEDYEYMALLKSLGDEKWALEMSRTVACDWHNWTQDAQKLEAVRVKLGDRIEELMQAQNK
ncbi:hypothetical protein NIES4102_24840 [Chondrocystis sp. NIES-4102]|nr:hypothetical protein NIES4102_24840 [Chondrocystis sp. NIES-4102]